MTTRIVRLISPDGIGASTQLLDLQGAPIPEIVKSVEIKLEAGDRARGTFVYYKNPQPAAGAIDALDTFEACVIFGAPNG